MTEYLDRYPTMHEYAEGKRINPKLTDLISRADAIDALSRSSIYAWSTEQDLVAHSWAIRILQSLPSADAVPTVIRAKTFMRKEDFDKWAEDIKKQNKSIVCIPCDAEVVSADAEQGWILCSERLPKEEERVLTCDNIGYIDFGQYDKGQWYWEAEACADYWAKNDGVIAWMPLPTPYKGCAE